MITHQEFARWSTPGLVAGLTGGMTISVPTVLHFGKPALKKEVHKEVIMDDDDLESNDTLLYCVACYQDAIRRKAYGIGNH